MYITAQLAGTFIEISRWTNIPNCSKVFNTIFDILSHKPNTVCVLKLASTCHSCVRKGSKSPLREVKLNAGSGNAVPGVKCVASC